MKWRGTSLLGDEAGLSLLARNSGELSVLPEVLVKDDTNHGELVEYMKLPGIYKNLYAINIKKQYQSPVLVN